MAVRVRDCRVCGSTLRELWELGDFALCGHFPLPGEEVPIEPMGLSHCEKCSLVQMHYRYDQDFYGNNYGYRSGLNPSMVGHLNNLAKEARAVANLWIDDVILDIGGNDGTLLKNFSGFRKVLMDPTAFKWRQYHDKTTEVLSEPFSADRFLEHAGKRAKLIFSVAMFYDLEDPVGFTKGIAKCLAEDGLWVLEQSYLPSMVEANAFDTICHEHLEYYSLASLRFILREANLKIKKVEKNRSNGGSFRVYVGWDGDYSDEVDEAWNSVIRDRFLAMVGRLEGIKKEVFNSLAGVVYGYGASTKGNTLLQYFGITPNEIPYIVDVNPEKYGKVTPGTGIPIIPEGASPDAYLVLPWHFKDFIIRKERRARLIFPLPEVKVWESSFSRL